MMRRIAAIALLLLAPAQAQQAPLPKEVQAEIEANKKVCGERVTLAAKFVSAKDVNADGKTDYVLDYEHFQCGEMIDFFCGSAGCLVQVFASLPDGSYVRAWDENVRAIRFAKVAGKPAMFLDLHGNACGKVGAAPCPRTLIWNGKTFAPRR